MSKSPFYAFLHGGMQGGWVWQETLAALGQQTSNSFGQACVLDVPGCGVKRSRSNEGLALEEVARELVLDMESAGGREVILVGHSQAGTMLPLLVRAKPRLFSRVIFVSCIAPAPGETVIEFGRSSLKFDSDEDTPPNWAQYFCNDMSPSATKVFLEKLGADAWPPVSYTAQDWSYDHLEGIPSAYICLLKDTIVPMAAQRACASRLHADRLIYIDAGHQVMNTRPHALAEILRFEAEIAT